MKRNLVLVQDLRCGDVFRSLDDSESPGEEVGELLKTDQEFPAYIVRTKDGEPYHCLRWAVVELVRRPWPEGKTSEQVNEELTKLCRDFLSYLEMDKDEDLSTQMLMNMAGVAHRLGRALDDYYSSSNCKECEKERTADVKPK